MTKLLLILVLVLAGCKNSNCDEAIAAHKGVWSAPGQDMKLSESSTRSGDVQTVTLMYPRMGFMKTFMWGGFGGCTTSSSYFPAIN